MFKQQFLLGQVSGLYTFILLCVVIATKVTKLLIDIKNKNINFSKTFWFYGHFVMKLLIYL